MKHTTDQSKSNIILMNEDSPGILRDERCKIKEDDSSSPNMEEDGSASDNDNDNDNETLCPLFMDRLPSNFAKNPALAAIASLLEEEEEAPKKADKEKTIVSKMTPLAGGGKARRTHRRKSASPYPKPNNTKKAKAAVGEAQLFLKLWKL
jgi:hypothetical protein